MNPSKPVTSPIAVHDVSRHASACLASDAATTERSADVSSTWAAMQNANPDHSKNIRETITPADDPHQAQPYLASLIAQHCDVIITVGPTFGRAIPLLGKANSADQFVAVDSSLTAPPPNTKLLSGSTADSAIADIVQSLTDGSAAHT
ncbi:hypothetical protein ACIGXM_35975 [Kitasatospora sp. NPDC052896]|uniref:hypothetical protein n=1 Tax=Kitasatospora sp. NPDC052896 TaxID=3364061 RepID=UPI0037C9F970